MSIEEAEGFAGLGLWQDAWDVLESLPGRDFTPAALRIALGCCALLDKWDVGTEFAILLEEGSREDREAASYFYQIFARECLRMGNVEGAEQMAEAAIEAWPDGLIDVLSPAMERFVCRLLEDEDGSRTLHPN